MSSAARVALTAKANLVTAISTLYPPPVLVTYGPEGTYKADDIIEILGVSAEEIPDTRKGGTLRRGKHRLTIRGVVSCYRGGGLEVQQDATERCLAIVEGITEYLQDSGTPSSTQITLGGAVLWARLSSFDLEEEDEDILNGRTTAAEFVIDAYIEA